MTCRLAIQSNIILNPHVLKSYYKVAREGFIDNVRMQGASRFLVTGPDALLYHDLQQIDSETTGNKCWRRIVDKEKERGPKSPDREPRK